MLKTTPHISANHRPYVVMGLATAFIVFGCLGTWALVARLDSAVIASGIVNVETNRKTVQHFEGGIVSAINVAEGQMVQSGAVLVNLRPVQAEAQLETQSNNLDRALALEARLSAERDGIDHVDFAPELMVRSERPMTRRVINDQDSQFKERRALLEAQVNVLANRLEQLKSQNVGLIAVNNSMIAQLSSLRSEYKKVTPLADRGFFPVNRYMDMERRVHDLVGRQGQSQADIAKNQEAIGETTLQILQTKQKFREEVVQALREARLQVGELKEKIRVSQDVLTRQEIRAPITGRVQNLHFHTEGGVVRAGEAIMEIVPLNDVLLVHAKVAPLDIQNVYTGLEAEVRFPGVKAKTTPLVMGRVRTVSADVLKDDTNQRDAYYLAIVEVREADLPPILKGKLSAGMPADVLIATGERTVAHYLVSPIMDAARKTMREQ